MAGKCSELDNLSVYGVVFGVVYCVTSEKALINEDECSEHKLRVELRRFVVETRPGHFWNFFSLNLCSLL